MKLKHQNVLDAERRLGSSGTKNSWNYEEFVDGYFKDWFAVHQDLYEFYGRREIRNMRFHTAWARKRLYDLHII